MSTKVVVAQTYSDCFRDFQDILGKNRDIELNCLSVPKKVLELIASKGADVLVTGQCFYGHPFKTSGDPNTLVDCCLALNDEEYARGYVNRNQKIYEGVDDGNVLAERARILNPEIITLRYSMTPEKRDYFCGDIDKFTIEGIEVLGSEEFLEALRQKDKSMLPSSKAIDWYLENFPVSWKDGGRE